MGRYEAHSIETTLLLDYTADDNATAYFTLPSWAMFVAVVIPDLDDDANIGIEISDDDGSTYYPVLDPIDGQDLVICDDTPSDPAYVSVSQFIDAFMPEGATTPTRFRFTTSVGQTGDKTFRVFIRG